MPALKKTMAVLLGSLILSVGINFFLVPFKVLDGGLIGIGLIFKYLLGVKAGLTMILFSIPIFILAWFKYRSYFYNSLHGLLISSFMIDVLQPYQYYFLYYFKFGSLVSAITGGLLVGIGTGLMLRFKTSTGGTDLVAQFFSDMFSVNVGIVIFFIDSIVIGLGGLLISQETFILSIITITAVGFSTTLSTLKTVTYE